MLASGNLFGAAPAWRPTAAPPRLPRAERPLAAPPRLPRGERPTAAPPRRPRKRGGPERGNGHSMQGGPERGNGHSMRGGPERGKGHSMRGGPERGIWHKKKITKTTTKTTTKTKTKLCKNNPDQYYDHHSSVDVKSENRENKGPRNREPQSRATQ